MARIKHIEIAGRDGENLKKFYSELFGWRMERKDVSGFDYYDIDIEHGGKPTAGIRHEPDGKAELVVYIEVDSLADTVARAEKLGGRVRIPPMTYGGLDFALIEDPEGNPVGLTEA